MQVAKRSYTESLHVDEETVNRAKKSRAGADSSRKKGTVDGFPMRELPDELLEHMLGCLGYLQQRLLLRTCKRWRQLLQSPWLLQSVIIQLPKESRPNWHGSPFPPDQCLRLLLSIRATGHTVKIVTLDGQQDVMDRHRALSTLKYKKRSYILVRREDQLAHITHNYLMRLMDGVWARLVPTPNLKVCNLIMSQLRPCVMPFASPAIGASVSFRNCLLRHSTGTHWISHTLYDRGLLGEWNFVLIRGEYKLLFTEANNAYGSAWRRKVDQLIEENAVALTVDELATFLRHIPAAYHAARVLVAVVNNLCSRWNQAGDFPLTTDPATIGYLQMKPIIQRLLYIWLLSHTDLLNSKTKRQAERGPSLPARHFLN